VEQSAAAGLATAGLITGYIAIAWIFVIGMLAAIAIPNFCQSPNRGADSRLSSKPQNDPGRQGVVGFGSQKESRRVPAESDLFGPDKYISQ